jgi:hypothetical protein
MGSHDFHTSVYAKTADEAFKEAQQEAQYEYGHNPYNGTISTVMGFKMIPFEEDETPRDWHNRVIEDPRIEKWEDCACAADPDEPIENGYTLWHFSGWAAC